MRFHTGQHRHDCGVDLHTRYWLADLCAREGIAFVLGHALFIHDHEPLRSERRSKRPECGGVTSEAVYEAEALDPAFRGCTGIPAARLLAAIRAVIGRSPAWGVRKVWAFLRPVCGWIVSRRRVWRLMKGARPGAASAPERREALPRGHVAVPDSNRRWATDLTTQAVFGQPRQVPDGLELRSDYGPQYTGADAEAVCQRWHVLHTFAPVARPTGNAVAERVIQTLKVELLWTRDWESIAELEQAIVEWVDRYNHQRPHQALDWRTPAQQRAINLNAPLERAA